MKPNKKVKRFDLGEIKSATRTPQGFLKCPGFATRVGVFPYRNPDGTVRNELRHPDDVFAPESLLTLQYAPVTIEHPPEMINPTNVDKYRKGHTTERVEINRNMVDTDLIVESIDAIDAVEKEGIRELSSGYDCDVVEEQGVYEGTPYDFRQKNIRYNHVALVKSGRAGPEVRIRLDSADAVMQKPAENVFSQESGVSDSEDPETKKVIILGREVDLPSDVADVLHDYQDRFDEMRAKLAKMEENEMSKQARKDEDVNQPGVSPQVKVEQQGPDGRSAGGKTPAKPGSMTGGGTQKTDEEENEHKDEDQHGAIGGQKPNSKEAGASALADDEDMHGDDDPAEGKGGGGMESPMDLLRKDAEEKKMAYDAAQAKLDEAAAASMNQPEKGPKMDSADVQKAIRARAKLERQAEKLVPFQVSKRFDSMSDAQIMKEVIKYRSPKADLEGKSKTYLQSRFDSIVESFDEEGTQERQNAGKAFLGLGGNRMDGSEDAVDPNAARLKMINEGRSAYRTEKFSAAKKQ